MTRQIEESTKSETHVEHEMDLALTKYVMYQDVVALLPGVLGFSHFGGFYYFADRVASALRGALETETGRSIPVLPFSTLPTGTLEGRQEFLLGALARVEAELGGVDRFHLVGHSAGGVDAYLLTQDRPLGDGPADPRGMRKKIRSVITIGSPHWGTGLANTDFAQLLDKPFSHMGGIPQVGKTIVDALRSAAKEPNLPTGVAGALQDWRQSFVFLGQVLRRHELIRALRPERMAELQARCKPDPQVKAKLTCFVTATAVPVADKSDPLFRDFHALTAHGAEGNESIARDSRRLLELVGSGKGISGADGVLPRIDSATNDGIVTTACQVAHLDRPEEFGGLVVADHGDVLGCYPRVDLLSSFEGGTNDRKTIHTGLFHSGAAFRDDQFFELYRRVAHCIRDVL